MPHSTPSSREPDSNSGAGTGSGGSREAASALTRALVSAAATRTSRSGRGDGSGGTTISATRMSAAFLKPESRSRFMWRSRREPVLPPNTTPISRRPLRSTEATRLNPEAPM